MPSGGERDRQDDFAAGDKAPVRLPKDLGGIKDMLQGLRAKDCACGMALGWPTGTLEINGMGYFVAEMIIRVDGIQPQVGCAR